MPFMNLPATEDRLDARQLAEAFRQFSEESEALTGAYAGLQTQVGQLTERLSGRTAAIRERLEQKMGWISVANRYGELLRDVGGRAWGR